MDAFHHKCSDVFSADVQAHSEKVAIRWSRIRDPVRPSPNHIQTYKTLMEPVRGRDALVLGATPELVDMLLDEVGAVTSAEQDAVTAAGMERLGTRSWSAVRRVTSRWETLSRELGHGGFGLAVSDGGPMYFPFTEGWMELFAEIHSLLGPGGLLLVRLASPPEDVPSFHEYLEGLEAQWAQPSRECDAELFAREATMATLATRFGALREDGNLDLDKVSANFEAVHHALQCASFTEERAAVTDAFFGSGHKAGDVSPLCATPPSVLVERVAVAAGFDARIQHIPDIKPVPNWSFFLVARKR